MDTDSTQQVWLHIVIPLLGPPHLQTHPQLFPTSVIIPVHQSTISKHLLTTETLSIFILYTHLRPTISPHTIPTQQSAVDSSNDVTMEDSKQEEFEDDVDEFIDEEELLGAGSKTVSPSKRQQQSEERRKVKQARTEKSAALSKNKVLFVSLFNYCRLYKLE